MSNVCSACKLPVKEGSPDPCLGHLPGVKNACCGHGDPHMAYVQFDNGCIIRGIGGFDHVPQENTLNRRLSLRCTIHGPIMLIPNPWKPIKGYNFAIMCPACDNHNHESDELAQAGG